MDPNFLKIRSPATLVVSGPTGSGKTELCKQIIQNLDIVFDRPPTQIVYCYSVYQRLFEDMKKRSPVPIEFVCELSEDLRPKPRTLLILDDLQNSAKIIADYFTKHSHHSDCDVLYITQNIFLQNDSHRTCNLNSHILILFKNPRNSSQVIYLARQISPGNPKFLMEAYKEATKKAHGYLFLNLQQATPDHLRVRDSVFYTEATFFVDKKEYKPVDLNEPETILSAALKL